ncbi:MAG TPA: hypothetical protein VFA15_04295, partial [Nitrososphaera sp.]|nr:hypothetical protein [Nitrososphaera sp.]
MVAEKMLRGHRANDSKAVNDTARNLQKQIIRLLRNPGKHVVFGTRGAVNPFMLLRQELTEFKEWKEDQQWDTTHMPIEEIDSRWNAYLHRTRPTREEEDL